MIYLIRHGRTEANEKHFYCGSTDLPLTESGREALKAMHYEVGTPRFITSGMKRTEETLRLLFGDVPHTVDREFREIDFGVFEMHGYEDLRARADYQAWITGDNDANSPPEGESGDQMRRRVVKAFRKLQEENRDTVVITHGGVIAIILETLFPDCGHNRYQLQPRPGCGYAIEGDRFRPIP